MLVEKMLPVPTFLEVTNAPVTQDPTETLTPVVSILVMQSNVDLIPTVKSSTETKLPACAILDTLSTLPMLLLDVSKLTNVTEASGRPVFVVKMPSVPTSTGLIIVTAHPDILVILSDTVKM